MRTMSGVDLTNPDSLGLGARQAANDRRQRAFGNGELSVGGLIDGMSMDPQWDGFLETMNGTRARQAAPVGVATGTVQNPGQASRQIGAAGQSGDVMRGIEFAAKRQNHEQFMRASGRL